MIHDLSQGFAGFCSASKIFAKSVSQRCGQGEWVHHGQRRLDLHQSQPIANLFVIFGACTRILGAASGFMTRAWIIHWQKKDRVQ